MPAVLFLKYMVRKIIIADNFLSAQGYSPGAGEMLAQILSGKNYSVVKAGKSQNKFIRLLQMLSAIWKHRRKATVIISTYSTQAFYFAVACAALCKALRMPYIAWLHGGDLPQRFKRSATISNYLFSNSEMNVAVSGYLYQIFIEKKWKCTVIHNGIALQNYPFKQRKNIQPRLLWVRSFHQLYNPQLAIEIVRILIEHHPEVKLTMVGPYKDGSIDACKTLVMQYGFEEKVIFTGLLSKPEWIRLSTDHDIFLNTTNTDNAPVSVIEAMALGMIVLSTDVGGLPNIIDEKNGVLLPPGNAEIFAEKIAYLLNHPEDCEALSKQANSYAQQYDLPNITLQWKKLMESMPH